MEFVRPSLMLVVVTGCGSLFAFLFQHILASQMTPDRYGLINALLGLLTWLAIPALALQVGVARRAGRALASGRRADAGPVLAVFGQVVALLAGVYLLVLGLAGPWLQATLHLDSWSPLVVTFVAGTLTLGYYVGLGMMQALERFRVFGGAQVAFALGRLTLGGGAAALGLGLVAILGGVAVGLAVVTVALLVMARVAIAAGDVDTPASTTPAAGDGTASGPLALLRELLPLFAGFGGFHALLQLDVIYAQATFVTTDPQLPGLYASAAVLGRVVLYLPMAIVGVTVPAVVRARERGEPHRHLLAKNLLMWVGLAGSGALLLGLWPAQALELFGRGDQLVPAAPLLRWYLLPILLFGALHVLMNYYYASACAGMAGSSWPARWRRCCCSTAFTQHPSS